MYEDSKQEVNNTHTETNPQSYGSKSSRAQQKPYVKAIEEYRKLCLKTYSTPNQGFASILKTEQLNLFLDTYSLPEILVINKLIGKYFYFKHIQLAPYDPQKGNPNEKKKKGFGIETPLTPSEKEKAEKDKKEQQYSKIQKIYHIVQGIAKNLCLSDNVITFSINGLNLSQELTSFLSEGIIENKTLQGLSVTNCNLPIDSYEILLKGLLTHEKLEFLNLSNNNFNDKYGNMIGRIIARQTQRRDQVIWAYGLRNEKPLTNDYTRGLISINLSGNQLGDISADNISNALSYDQYVRNVDLSANNFSKESCKKFIHMLRKNFSILTMDLKENPGYDPEIHARIVMKMSKNIRFLYQQFQDEKIEKEEFEYLKSFIDGSFFEVEIPEEMAAEMFQGDVNTNQTNENGEEEMTHPVEEGPEEEEQGEEEENVHEENPQINEEDPESGSDLKETNRQLLAENLQLKKELLSIRAKLIKESIDSKEKNEDNKPSASSIETNYYKIVGLLNELNGLMDNVENSLRKENKDKSNNKKSNSVEKLEDPKEESQQEIEKKDESSSIQIKKNNESDGEGKYNYQEMQAEPSVEPSENEKQMNAQLFENEEEEEEEEIDDKRIIRNEESNDYGEEEEYEYEQEPEFMNHKMNKSF